MVSIIQVDVQNCDIKLESWGYLDTKLKFQWDMDGNQIAEGLNKTLTDPSTNFGCCIISYGNKLRLC